MSERRRVVLPEPGSPRYSDLAAQRWAIEAVVRRELEALQQSRPGKTHIGRAARPVDPEAGAYVGV